MRYRGFESPPLRFRKPRMGCQDPAQEAGFLRLSGKSGDASRGQLGGKLDSSEGDETDGNALDDKQVDCSPPVSGLADGAALFSRGSRWTTGHARVG